MDKFANIGWPDMLLMALVGFLIVFAVLILMIYIMKAMGYFFTRQRKPKAQAAKGDIADDHAISDAEIVAAIAVALKMYKSDLHDRESEVITINRITRAYSPWNSKIHGLTQLPKHK